jgi:predicted transcriptional regulator of viral defense system
MKAVERTGVRLRKLRFYRDAAKLRRMPSDYDRADYLTPTEVARMWGVTPSAVRKACQRPLGARGHIPGVLRTPTGRYLIPRKSAALRPAGIEQS